MDEIGTSLGSALGSIGREVTVTFLLSIAMTAWGAVWAYWKKARADQAAKAAEASADFFHGPHALGDVGREFHDTDYPATVVEDRVVGGLDEDLAAAFSEAHELISRELASVQGFPETAIVRRAGIIGIAEHRVMLSNDLVQTIAERGEEIVVGGEDPAGGVEFDNGLCA